MATEKRLIDANDLLELYDMGDELEGYASVLSVPIPVIRQNIKDMPTVDAVEVVRCGECKHFCEPFCIRRDDETHRERINMLTVDFCSYGERKDNE